ncbi:MAG: hypothetical protein OXC69_06070 [Candidatus Tectomicrobia bacterium]|nr:hypothetical protein [Candidatus Tectomicrobia bacterium]
MLRKCWLLAGMLTLLLVSGLAYAQSDPDTVVEQYVMALSQGRFAEARALTLETANLDGSIFGSWLFRGRGGLPTATADLFLSQKFVEGFRYTITGTLGVGENQVFVTAVRSSPDVAHLYEWAVLPVKDAAPYDIISAIDTYLTTVNYPVEESRLRFTLIREVDAWFISAITDAKFVRLREVPSRQAARTVDQSDVEVSPAVVSPEESGAREPAATTTSPDVGRLLADARFHATLQGFNDTFRSAAGRDAEGPGRAPARRPFWKRLVQRLRPWKNSAQVAEADLDQSLQNIREALTRYTINNDNIPPEEALVRDWRSLRQLVSDHGRKRRQIPDNESDAGFRFVNYSRDSEGFVLQLEFLSPRNGFTHAEITPYRVTRTH